MEFQTRIFILDSMEVAGYNAVSALINATKQYQIQHNITNELGTGHFDKK